MVVRVLQNTESKIAMIGNEYLIRIAELTIGSDSPLGVGLIIEVCCRDRVILEVRLDVGKESFFIHNEGSS